MMNGISQFWELSVQVFAWFTDFLFLFQMITIFTDINLFIFSAMFFPVFSPILFYIKQMVFFKKYQKCFVITFIK